MARTLPRRDHLGSGHSQEGQVRRAVIYLIAGTLILIVVVLLLVIYLATLVLELAGLVRFLIHGQET
jgi:hypothetical protein